MSISGADSRHTAQDTPPYASAAINLAELNAADDPYPRYAELRRSGRLLKGGPAQWIVTHHADVAPLLRDRRLVHRMPREYLEFQLGAGASADFQEHSLLNRDGPDHTRLRALMGKAFSAPLVRRMRDHIADLLEPLLEPLLSGEAFDVVDGIAHSLPSQVICELLGIEGVDREEVRHKVADLVGLDRARADAAIEWSRDYLGEVLAERRPDPDGDLLERMLAAEDGDDALSHDEIVDNSVLLFFAGFETTKYLISAGVDALLRFPDQLDRLLTDPTLAPTAVEEFLRFDSPVRSVSVVTTEPMEVCGRELEPMRVLHLQLACANHDADAFADPERLDIGRQPNPHVAFGGGAHHCLGAMLARVEGDVVFQALGQRLRGLERAGATERTSTGGLGSYLRLPVVALAK
jgi:cytochrome P450